MRKFVLKALVLLVAFALLSMVMPSVSAGDDPNGKPFLAISDRLDDLEGQIGNMGKWDKHGTDIAYTTGNVGIGTTTPSTKLHVEGIITATGGNSNEWNTAYSWSDHSVAGYLTSYAETDPIYGSSAAAGITNAKITDWDTAYGWGDHSTEGYLTSYTETDPVYGASAAASVTTAKITDWDMAYGWGDHSTEGYLTSYTETDPVYGASPAAGITAGKITDWDTAYGWGDHSTEGYLTSYTETDPQVGANKLNYVSKWDGSALVEGTMYDDGDIHIGSLPTGGDVCSGGSVTQSSYLYTRYGSKAFDNSVYTIWESALRNPPHWVKYDLGSGNEKRVVRYRIHAWDNYAVPSNWQFQGSNDNVNWDTLDTRTGESWPSDSWRTFDFDNHNSYRYYRLYISKVIKSGYGAVIIDEIEMIEGKDLITLESDGDGIFEGKITATGGVDPPFVSFSDETKTSIREYANNVEAHEEVMVFWNGEANRMEVYLIAEDKFYTITGQLIEE